MARSITAPGGLAAELPGAVTALYISSNILLGFVTIIEQFSADPLTGVHQKINRWPSSTAIDTSNLAWLLRNTITFEEPMVGFKRKINRLFSVLA